ncbi:MAG: nuclear transport factor 2 family protein [Saprospiraceae bacterium]|nr:nuclear transport factor 2 family protein [Saprospiraceae bacterium]
MAARSYSFIRQLFYLGLLTFLGIACNSNTADSNSTQDPEVPIITESLTADPSLASWAKLIRGTIDDLSEVYVEQPVFLGPTGTQGFQIDEQIQRHRIQYRNLTSLQTNRRILAHEERGYYYEIGQFTTAQQEEFKHLLILKKDGDTLRRELEFIAKASRVDSTVLDIFDQRRARWIELCNAHDAEKLVTNLYTPNAIYYNHKPLILGHEAITADYQYMNQANYALQLSPIVVELVNERTAFEIGQCSGSYGGKYLFVWQKDQEGKWSVQMDSNI